MNSYRNAEIEYRERCKARIQRQLEISEIRFVVLCRCCRLENFALNVVYLCIHTLYS